jgi:hypothetical protein
MSNPRDIIHAFEGILTQFRHSLKTKFWYGLPEIYFSEALLWLEAGPHVRREDCVVTSIGKPFTSWSWAGWNTKVIMNGIFVGYVHTEVDWFMVNMKGVAVRLLAPGC